MKKPTFPIWFLIAGALVCLAAGCGPRVKLQPVRGKVVYLNGQPVPGGFIEFRSVDLQPARVSQSVIQPDGTYQLETAVGAAGRKPGAISGKYQALVRSPPKNEATIATWKPTVHRRYGTYDASGLEFTIEPGGDENLTITVQPP